NNVMIIDTAGRLHIDEDMMGELKEIKDNITVHQTVLVVDASEGLTEQDVRIAGLIHEQGIPSVIVVNKWDLIKDSATARKEFEKQFETDLAFMKYYVTLYVSAVTKQRIGQIMEKVDYVLGNATKEIPMGMFNNVLTNAISTIEPPTKNGKRLKIIFGKQTSTCPPTFAIYCNRPEIVENSYARYLENSFRRAWDFAGTPIKVEFKQKDED
ncbi:MAG: GTP-binding protein, partial [Clostridia bacterium]|nr:GTP-binding protein [Clostridia bacterium]